MESDPGETQAAGVGDRQEIAGGSGAADGLSPAVRHLLATQGQGPEDDRQQRLQRLALRRCLARREIGPRLSGPIARLSKLFRPYLDVN